MIKYYGLKISGKGFKEKMMKIEYSISLWNYYHYNDTPSMERIIQLIRGQGYGIELWGVWKEERDLYDETGRNRLKNILQGMKVSIHTSGGNNTFDLHKKQIDAAVELGAGVIVLHSNDLTKDKINFDLQLTRDAVAYANSRRIKLALENGDLPFLVNAIEKVDGLGICLDTGHVYFTSDPMSKYLECLKKRIIHLHIQDIIPLNEDILSYVMKDHYIPGTGGIPSKDWELIATTLKEIDFDGLAVFEIHPRDPLQTAFLGKNFIQKFL